jgi:hypothetical protein
MNAHDELSSLFARLYESEKETEISLEDYLKACAREPMAYASAAERMLAAIGEPQLIDTSQETRLGRIFMNRTIRVYPAFQDFYGMEETIERIVGFLRHAAQGLEERKQVLYLRLEGGQGDEPDLREPARLVRPRAHGRPFGTALQDTDAPAHRADVALGLEAPRRVRWRHQQVQRGEDPPLAAAADLHREDRAR